MTSNIPAYIRYIKQLLQKSNYDKFIDDLTKTVERTGKMTPRQYDAFERYRRGDKRYSTKNENTNSLKYTPLQFQPDTSYLSKAEHDKMMDDLRGRSIDFIDYLIFVKSMAEDEPLYNSMFKNLGRGNLGKLKFKSDERKILALTDNPLLNPANYAKVMKFYEKYKDQYPSWARENGFFFNNLKINYGPQSN